MKKILINNNCADANGFRVNTLTSLRSCLSLITLNVDHNIKLNPRRILTNVEFEAVIPAKQKD
jgi:hypothetical protein